MLKNLLKEPLDSLMMVLIPLAPVVTLMSAYQDFKAGNHLMAAISLFMSVIIAYLAGMATKTIYDKIKESK